MTTKHTPGPWVFRPVQYVGKIRHQIENHPRPGFPSITVAHTVPSIYQHEKEANAEVANARLIAAAPDLLEACETLLVMIDLKYPEHTTMLVEARATIAKAKGAQ